MTTQTQERQDQDQEVSTDPTPWSGLSPLERIRIRWEIKKVCTSGGMDSHRLALRIAAVLAYQGDLEIDRERVLACDFNFHHARLMKEKDEQHALGVMLAAKIARVDTIAQNIVVWLLANKFLLDHGSDGIVICSGFPLKSADQV